MVGISSNIWGTKFKIHGLDSMLPAVIGQVKNVIYNTKQNDICVFVCLSEA